ncbi:MAG: hypothetical protein ACTSUK_04130, partial [Promethearchaeota archaeon]
MEQYYNEFQRIERIYYDLEPAISDNEYREIKYIYPLIIPDKIKAKLKYQIPFRLITILAQLKPILKESGVLTKTKHYLLKEYGNQEFDVEEFKMQLAKTSNWIQEMRNLIENEKNLQNKKEMERKIILFSILEEFPDELVS